MKIRKTAEQKNFILNKDFYTEWQLECFLKNGVASKVYDNDTEYRIFASQLSEVKVICEDGFYTTVAVDKNGSTFYITL